MAAAAAAAGTLEHAEPGCLSLYFCGSIRGGREDRELYVRIVSRLRRFGVVLTEHVAAAELDESGEEAAGGDKLIHDQDLAWLQQADVLSAMTWERPMAPGSRGVTSRRQRRRWWFFPSRFLAQGSRGLGLQMLFTFIKLSS